MSLILKSVRDARFKRAVMPYLEYGFNLALALVTDRSDAEDALQEASLKAYRAIDSLHNDDAKSWFLKIVRNECLNLLKRRNIGRANEICFNDDLLVVADEMSNPAAKVLNDMTRDQVRRAIDELPVLLKEALILREIQSLTYQQIATVTGAPMGTVMSRLSRARNSLMKLLAEESAE